MILFSQFLNFHFGTIDNDPSKVQLSLRRDPDSQSGMPALRAFSKGHFAAKLAFPISLSNPSRENKKRNDPSKVARSVISTILVNW